MRLLSQLNGDPVLVVSQFGTEVGIWDQSNGEGRELERGVAGAMFLHQDLIYGRKEGRKEEGAMNEGKEGEAVIGAGRRRRRRGGGGGRAEVGPRVVLSFRPRRRAFLVFLNTEERGGPKFRKKVGQW